MTERRVRSSGALAPFAGSALGLPSQGESTFEATQGGVPWITGTWMRIDQGWYP